MVVSSKVSFFLPLILLPAHSVLHTLSFSEQYFYIIFGYVFQVGGRYLPFVLLAGGVILFLAWLVPERLLMNRQNLAYLKWGAAALFVIFFLYNIFVRPSLGEVVSYYNPWDNILVENWNHANLIRLSWYLSPIGLAGSFLGITYLIFHLDKMFQEFLV